MATETEAIVDAAVAELEASGAAQAAEEAKQAARDAEHAMRDVEVEAELLQAQRHSELVSSYENRILELESTCRTLTETLSQHQTELQEALTRLQTPALVVVEGQEKTTQPEPSTSKTLTETTPQEIEVVPEAEPEKTPVQRKKRRIL
jgi:CII-binding regulator of phage lambda lysogenization HflD